MASVAHEDVVVAAEATGRETPGLPLTGLLDPQMRSSTFCAATTIDDRGRLADRTALKVMGWGPGAPTTISTNSTAGIILVRATGPDAVTRQGYIRLPARIRHGCRLDGGDCLLVVARPGQDLLVAYTAYALDAMTSAYHASITNGDVS